MYLITLYTHVGSVGLSLALFVVRGFWMLNDSALLKHPVTRVAPHIIDTVLLVSALTLAFMSSQYPFLVGWLTVKFFLLLVYIVLGTIALKRGRTKQQRVVAFFLALATFGFIVSVALNRHPLGILAIL